MKFKLRGVLRILAMFFAISHMMYAGIAEAAPYPDHSLVWVVPYSPGAATDAMARLLAADIGRQLNQSIVVENEPGAATITASTRLKRAAPDGYRIMSADITTLVLNPVLRKRLAYDPLKDFSMISMLAKLPLVLVGRPDFPANTLTGLLDYVKAHPGKVTFASPGLGSPHHMAMELLQSEAKVSMLHIPYNGTGPSMADLLAGRVDITFASVGVVAPYLAAGKLKAFGISSNKAFPTLPNVAPLHSEDPRLANFEAYAWQGLVAPAGLPQDRLDVLNHALHVALDNPQIIAKFAHLGLEPEASTPKALRDYVQQQITTWKKIAKERDIKLD
ncbi:tripartite tricarboxylate transporter substrate binding protein [Candidimonas humi]|uniref:Bug family tripartite tricarboxylate transporter substrate binding protein n=1 Tax=Candidimonas humi TaxID=683355 RepID=A0ABV8P1C6_9BURK|nr:tripartite tricarboxylate transporter substrate-binding protein [Candidimonas humi]MBV6305598.1 tripartite tricarboxylate transporter substrate binding protein [Candidimonas humi]